MTTAKRSSCTAVAARQAAGDLVPMKWPPKRWQVCGLATEIGAVASRREFRYKSGVAPAAAKVALRAGSFRGRTGRYVHGCDRCANFEPLGVERRRLQPEQCHLHCRLRGDHRAVLNRMAVGYRSPLLEYLLWKVKQRLHVWFQTERQHASYLATLGTKQV